MKKFVYFGSSQFSHIILKNLYLRRFIPSLIVSKPDKPKGRGLKVFSTDVSLFADSRKIPLIKPQSLKDKVIEEALLKERADFFIVADYGKIIPSSLLSIPEIFALCVHPSLLPYYRGPAPIEQALINGEKETGVTIFRINERIDAGDIVLRKKVVIDYEDDSFSLNRKLAVEGVLVLIEAISRIENKDYALISQDEEKATLTFKLKKEDGRIFWSLPAVGIRNLIRATLGWPSAYAYYKDLMIKILAADIIEEESHNNPGTIVNIDKKGIYVATPGGILKIKKLKPQGKKEMNAWQFVCGYRIKVGDVFS